MLVMAVYWVSEVMPMAVTALIPVVAFPLLGVMPAKTVAKNYFQVKYQCPNLFSREGVERREVRGGRGKEGEGGRGIQ